MKIKFFYTIELFVKNCAFITVFYSKEVWSSMIIPNPDPSGQVIVDLDPDK